MCLRVCVCSPFVLFGKSVNDIQIEDSATATQQELIGVGKRQTANRNAQNTIGVLDIEVK